MFVMEKLENVLKGRIFGVIVCMDVYKYIIDLIAAYIHIRTHKKRV